MQLPKTVIVRFQLGPGYFLECLVSVAEKLSYLLANMLLPCDTSMEVFLEVANK